MTVPKMAVLAVLLVLATAGLASPGAHVTVLKCCPYGETLDPHTQDGQPACMRVDNDAAASWAPRIYSRRQKTYLTAVPAHWTVHAASRPTCGERARMVVAHPNDQPVFLLIEDGRLYLHERSDQPLAPGRFCVDSTAVLVCLDKDDDSPVAAAATTAASANAIAEGAPVKNKLHKPRLRKCCIGEAVFSEEERGCVPRVSVPHLWTAAGGHLREDFTVVESFPKCAKETYGVRGLLPSMAKTVTSTAAPAPPAARVEQDGSVWLSSGTVLRPEDFCLENMVEIGAVAVLGCLGESPVGEPDLRFTLYPALLFLSVFFLAATLLASCLLPAAYHQLHWRCQTNYVASLMLGDLFLAVTQVAGAALKGPFCVVFAVLMHFLFLAAFFWLNTMCFNIWWTFRDLRPASVDKNQEAVRMRLYEVYAWGGPLVIAGVAAALDHLPADQYPHLLRPGFGLETCWFLGDMEILPYFFGPVAVLLFINLCLFIATARELTCGLWKADGAKPTTERATLRRVCLKLVVVMGVTWSVDVVSWAVGGPHSVWYVTDVVNLLQGVFIFIVVGCQPHVWSAVKRLWCLRESRSEASRRALHLSSTSQGPHSLGPDSFTITTTTTTTTTNGTPAKLQLQSNGNGSAPAPPAVGGDLAANSETPC